MLKAGDEMFVGTVIEAEKRTDVRSKNLCKSINYIQIYNVVHENNCNISRGVSITPLNIRLKYLKNINLDIFQ